MREIVVGVVVAGFGCLLTYIIASTLAGMLWQRHAVARPAEAAYLITLLMWGVLTAGFFSFSRRAPRIARGGVGMICIAALCYTAGEALLNKLGDLAI